jgi:hypothetical protein
MLRRGIASACKAASHKRAARTSSSVALLLLLLEARARRTADGPLVMETRARTMGGRQRSMLRQGEIIRSSPTGNVPGTRGWISAHVTGCRRAYGPGSLFIVSASGSCLIFWPFLHSIPTCCIWSCTCTCTCLTSPSRLPLLPEHYTHSHYITYTAHIALHCAPHLLACLLCPAPNTDSAASNHPSHLPLARLLLCTHSVC